MAILAAGQDPKTGAASLAALDLTGHELWRHVFPGYDSDRPPWNLGGLTLWTPAHLTDPHRLDVYVNTRRSTMHSDVSFALDGRTGAQIWTGASVPIRACRPGDSAARRSPASTPTAAGWTRSFRNTRSATT